MWGFLRGEIHQRRSRLSKIKQALFSLLLIVFVFFAAECVARLFYKPLDYKNTIQKEYIPKDDDYIIRHKTLGWLFKPGYDGKPKVFDQLGKPERYTINSQGLRDRDYPFRKSADCLRIFCSGDSITMGTGASNDDSYPKALERHLNRGQRGLRFEVINGGVGDYNSFQEYLLLKEIGLGYEPDIVILQYYPNDGRVYVPPKRIFLDAGLETVQAKSAFIYFLDRGIRRWMISIMKKQWEKGRERWQPRYKENKWLTDKNEVDALIEMADKDWGVAWREVGWHEARKQIEKMIALSKEHNFTFIVVYFPLTLQLNAAGSNNYDLLKPEKDIENFCEERNIPFFSLINPLNEAMRSETMEAFFVDHCHYTGRGAEVVAQSIGKFLVDSGLLQLSDHAIEK